VFLVERTAAEVARSSLCAARTSGAARCYDCRAGSGYRRAGNSTVEATCTAGLLSAALGVPLGASITSDSWSVRYVTTCALRAGCPIRGRDSTQQGGGWRLSRSRLRIARTLMAVRLRRGRAGQRRRSSQHCRKSFVRVDRPAVSAIVLAAGTASHGRAEASSRDRGRTIIEWVVTRP